MYLGSLIVERIISHALKHPLSNKIYQTDLQFMHQHVNNNLSTNLKGGSTHIYTSACPKMLGFSLEETIFSFVTTKITSSTCCSSLINSCISLSYLGSYWVWIGGRVILTFIQLCYDVFELVIKFLIKSIKNFFKILFVICSPPSNILYFGTPSWKQHYIPVASSKL